MFVKKERRFFLNVKEKHRLDSVLESAPASGGSWPQSTDVPGTLPTGPPPLQGGGTCGRPLEGRGGGGVGEGEGLMERCR